MVKAAVVVQPEQQGSDPTTFRRVAKSTNDTIDRPHILDLLHAGPQASLVRQIIFFGDHAIQPDLLAMQPLPRDLHVRRDRREPNRLRVSERNRQERLELMASRGEWKLEVRQQIEDDELRGP